MIDWTNVLEALIAGLPAIITAAISAYYAGKAHKKIENVQSEIDTPSGKPLGEVAEYTHDTAIANNLLLSRDNSTKLADHEIIETHATHPPQIPTEIPSGTDHPES